MAVASALPSAEPQPRLWTREEFHQLADIGFFEGQRAELIGGEIMVLSPQKSLHFKTADQDREVLEKAYGHGFWVRLQGPLALADDSEPEPDVSVVEGRREDYAEHPASALLALEVSDTTLANDRGRKGSLYAAAGIGAYWIVNLVDDQLEVYTGPVPDPSQPHGFAYSRCQVLHRGDNVSLPGPVNRSLRVDDLLA